MKRALLSRDDLKAFLLSSVSREAGSGCWLWNRSLSHDGYGRAWDGKKLCYAHRVVYETFVGPIPEGFQVDHLCKVRRCVNPEHLEPVTQHENWRRGDAPSAILARAIHCSGGHEFSSENTYVSPDGKRKCRTCLRKKWKRENEAKKRAGSQRQLTILP